MRRAAAQRLLAPLRQAAGSEWAGAAAGGAAQPHACSSSALACLPATLSSSSAAAWQRAGGSPLIRLPSDLGLAAAGLQQQQQQRHPMLLRHFSSRGEVEGAEAPAEERPGAPERSQSSHARPRWRELDTNSAHRSVAYNIELGLLHRQLYDRSALDDKVREKFKLDIWDNVLVDVKRTVKVTKSAKVETFHAIVATGNHAGMFGVGEGADSNVQKAVSAAFFKSFANIVNVPLYRGHTIYHRIDHKRHTTSLMMLPKEYGKGVRASNLIYELCVLAGIKDVTIKIRGRTRNKANLVKLFVEALGRQTLPHDGVEGSGAYIREVLKPAGRRLPFGIKRGVDLP